MGVLTVSSTSTTGVILALFLLLFTPAYALGGEKAKFNTMPQVLPHGIQEESFAFDGNAATTTSNFISHRQDLCGRYELYRNRTIPLRDALKDLKLNVVFPLSIINYSNEGGIDKGYAGIGTDLMDMLAVRAGFTYRNSFGIVGLPGDSGMTWTEQVWWGVNTYDMYINRCDQSLERMEMGVAFMEPWYDASIILIDKRELFSIYTDTFSVVTLWNWARPFEASVWAMIFATILFSGLIFQFIEHMDGDRQDRPKAQWFYDNLYLSSLNFTQQFSYAPTSGAGRIFSFSMAFWAMIVTATYTANLAGFMIIKPQPAPTVQSISDAIIQKIPICTYKDTNADNLIRTWYPTANRVPYDTEPEMYKALHNGMCGLVAGDVSGWNTKRIQETYNPKCNLERVGDTVSEIRASFAMKVDVGFKCTSLIRDVLNVHLTEIIADKSLQTMWEGYRERNRTNKCFPASEEINSIARAQTTTSIGGDGRRLKIKQQSEAASNRHRRLPVSDPEKGGDGEQSLSLEEMAGTFLLHYALMLISVLASLGTPYWRTWKLKRGWVEPVPVTLGLSRLQSYAKRRIDPKDLHVDASSESYEDTENQFGRPVRRNPHAVSSNAGLFVGKEQVLPPLMESSEEVVENQLMEFEKRQQKKLDEHMAMVVMMLNDMTQMLSKLGVQDDSGKKRQSSSSAGKAIRSGAREASVSTSDFGGFLRQNLSPEVANHYYK